MDSDSVTITCRKCKATYSLKEMVQHTLMAKRCKGTYTKDHHTSLRNHLKEHLAEKKIVKEDQRMPRLLEMEEQTCRGCQKIYPIKSILQHVNRSKCRQSYNDDQYTSLQACLKEISAAKKKIRNAQRYLDNKAKIAENYDPIERAEKYSENRSKILGMYNPTKRAEKYSENRSKILKKYNPAKRAEKYSESRTKISRKYKPKERAMKYSLKKAEISKRNLEKYDPIKRHELYERDRIKISLGYYKRRSIKTMRYDKDLRKIKYKKEMAKIARQRKELKEKKECKGGEIFSRLFGYVCRKVFHNIENNNIDCALGMQEDRKKEYEDNVHDPIFEKETWSTTIFHYQTYDCERVNNCVLARSVLGYKDSEPKPCDELNSKYTNHRGRKQWCIQHMDESEWDDIIFDAMVEKLREETEKSRMKDAKIEAGKEMKLAFERDYSPLFLPCMYSDAADRSLNKAFKTLFFKEDSEIYEKAKSTATLKWQESKYETEFCEFLIEELEASGMYVSEKISKIFEDNFLFALEQKFSFFKKSVPDEMRSENTKRKEWAFKMLSKIKEEDSMNKGKEKLIENAKVQIEKIYQKYEEEITAAYKNCEVPFEHYFCFTDVVNQYPTFKGPREDPLFNSLTDNYEVCLENLSQVIRQGEIEKCKAGQVFSQVCDKVFPDYFDKITGDHLHYALYLENEDREDYETELFDDIFEDELWIENFNSKTFDCGEHKRYHASGMQLTCSEIAKQLSKECTSNEKKCLSHMTNLEFGVLVEKTMDDTLNEEIDKMMLEEAKKKVKKEFELVFGKGYSPLVLPSLYIEVDEMSRSKAFNKLFLKKDSKLYEDAKQSAFKKWQKSEYKEELSCLLIEELEALGVCVSDEISQIFKDDLIDTLDEKFELFKESVPFEMKSKNSERREWAMKKLEEIEAAEKDSMEKDKKSLIENARNQITKIYEKYEKEITDAYENCTVSYEVPFHSFSEVVDQYPDFKGPTEDPLFNSFTDQYEVWFEKTWKEIEIRKEKCTCYSCINNLYLTDECERVIRQRQLEMTFRTCPLCQKNIPFKWFDQNWHFKRDH